MPTDLPLSLHLVAIGFVFAFGACCGSFLNVVVYRLPNVAIPETAGMWRAFRLSMRGLSHPPSTCPKCNTTLAVYDNIPILGWLWLRGRCRFCKAPISAQYPIVELLTALLFASLYLCFFFAGPALGPPTPVVERTIVLRGELALMQDPASFERAAFSNLNYLDRRNSVPVDASPAADVVGVNGRFPAALVGLRARAFLLQHWPMLVIALALSWCLLAASLIDWQHYMIPRGLSYLPALVALPLHALFDRPGEPMSLIVGPIGCAWAIGGGVGLLVSLALLKVGWLQRSWAAGMPMLDVEREAAGEEELTPEEERAIRRQTMRETLRELAFVAVPLMLGAIAVALALGPMRTQFDAIADLRPLSAALGSLLGGLIGGGVIWGIRLLGSFAFGREAMGLGDVDLMFGVGCCLGAGPAGIAVFPAALIGILFSIGKLLARGPQEIPFGPSLAAASVLLIVTYNHVADYVRPALPGVAFLFGPIAPFVGL